MVEEEDEKVLLSTESISKYDILVFEKDNELDFVSSDQVTPPHIGNNRLKVFCKMNTQNFIKATTEAEQNHVITTILHICEQQCANDNNDAASCTTSGKFWKAGTTANTWDELPRSEAMEFIKGLLENEQEEQAAIDDDTAVPTVPEEEKKRRRRSSLLRRSLSSGNMIEDQKKRVAYRRSVLMQLETLDVSDDEGDEDDEEDLIIRRIQPTSGEKGSQALQQKTETKKPPPPSSQSNASDETESEDDDELNSEADKSKSTTANDQDTISTAPKSNLRRTIARSPSLTSLSNLGANTIVTAEALDVILLRKGDAPYELVANHTGNNRLLVMIHQRTHKYQEICHNKLEVHRLCLDLVDTIGTFYNGRFLVEQSNANFLKLTPEQAAAALVAVFAAQVKPAAPVVATKQSAMEAIAALSAGTAVASEAHKTALESLKQKKKRQETQNKITLNYARFGGPADKPPPTVVMQPRQQFQQDFSPLGALLDLQQHSMAIHARPGLDQRAQSVGALQQPSPIEPQPFRRASVGIMPAPRRSTLSAFSAGMIEDMLHRLDAEAQELEQRQREFR